MRTKTGYYDRFRHLVGKQVYEFRESATGSPRFIRTATLEEVSPKGMTCRTSLTSHKAPSSVFTAIKFAPITDEELTAAYEAQEQDKRAAQERIENGKRERDEKAARITGLKEQIVKALERCRDEEALSALVVLAGKLPKEWDL